MALGPTQYGHAHSGKRGSAEGIWGRKHIYKGKGTNPWLSREPGDSKPGEERAGEQGDVEASRSGQDQSAGCRGYAASGGPGELALG